MPLKLTRTGGKRVYAVLKRAGKGKLYTVAAFNIDTTDKAERKGAVADFLVKEGFSPESGGS